MNYLVMFALFLYCVRSLNVRGEPDRLDKIWVKLFGSVDPLVPGIRPWKPSQPKHTSIPYEWSRVASAPTDECYCGANYHHEQACTDFELISGCKDKRNEAYAWGMTRTHEFVFWGVVGNVQCLATGRAHFSGEFVCDGQGKDWRRPRLYMHRIADGSVKDISEGLSGHHFSRLNDTIGIRAAGNRDGVVILAGPSKTFTSVYMFAFDASNGDFITSTEFIGFNDVRKFTTDTAHRMYVGLSKQEGSGGGHGVILRYKKPAATQRRSIDSCDSLSFEMVTSIDGYPAELTFYKERLLVGTWPIAAYFNASESIKNIHYAALLLSEGPIDDLPGQSLERIDNGCAYRSDTVTRGGAWRTVWKITDYEPDQVVGITYGTSVQVTLNNNWVYWGTLQLPFVGATVLDFVYGPPRRKGEKITRILGSWRPTAIFRGRNLECVETALLEGSTVKNYSNPRQDQCRNSRHKEVQLLYGERFLPVYKRESGKWQLEKNAMQAVPRFGRSGFGNMFNLYTWSMARLDNCIILGTLDISFGVEELLKSALKNEVVPSLFHAPPKGLLRNSSSSCDAHLENMDTVWTKNDMDAVWMSDGLHSGCDGEVNGGEEALNELEKYALSALLRPSTTGQQSDSSNAPHLWETGADMYVMCDGKTAGSEKGGDRGTTVVTTGNQTEFMFFIKALDAGSRKHRTSQRRKQRRQQRAHRKENTKGKKRGSRKRKQYISVDEDISPAEWITLSGLDNRLNYGFRNIVVDSSEFIADSAAYVGTANPFNVDPHGGWEVYRLSKRRPDPIVSSVK